MATILDFNSALTESELANYLKSNTAPDKERVLVGLNSEVEHFAAWLFPSAIVTRTQVLVGDVHGSPGTSLKIETKGSKRGIWKDFADPAQKGGDLINLYMAAHGVSFPRAIEDLADWVGKGTRPEINYQREQATRKLKKIERDLGAPVGTWHYTDADGTIIASVYRYEPEDGGKEYLPWDAQKRQYGNPDIRPLYNLPGILKADDVVFCEGEKAADALIKHGFCATSVMGGSNSPLERSDLAPLKGKKVIIWPDADEPGEKFAAAVAYSLKDICDVSIIELPDTVEKGWDAADAAADEIASLLKSPVKSEPQDPNALTVVDAFDFDESQIPPRPWIVPGAILAGYTHMLAAPGGVGKSLFTLQMAIALATGDTWGSFKPRRRYKSLLINVEDDLNEQRRRLAAARRVMNPDQKYLKGMIHLVDAADSIIIAGHDVHKKSIVAMPVVETLCRYIIENNIEVLFVDPFAETFEGNENDNSEVKWAMKIWRDQIAKTTGCAVYLIHHTTKNASGGAGDQNIVRGGGAIVNSTRISSTLMPMTPEEADFNGIERNEAHLYIRFDDAKANQSLKDGHARWFQKQSILLSNGANGLEADEVGALVPWVQADPFDGLSIDLINRVLDYIDEGFVDADGVVTESRYTLETRGGSTKEGGRWAGHVLIQQLDIKPARAKIILGHWERNKVLLQKPYTDPADRKKKTGVFVNEDKRPGEKK